MSSPEVAYTAVCAECVEAATVEFESADARAEWMADHTQRSEHDAWYLGETVTAG